MKVRGSVLKVKGAVLGNWYSHILSVAQDCPALPPAFRDSSRPIRGSILHHRVWNQGKAFGPPVFVLVNSAPAYFQLYCKYYFKSRFATTLLTTSYDYSKCRKFHSLLTRRISLEKIKALPRSLSALPFKLKGNCYLIKPPPPAGPPGPAPGWRGEALL